jgi:hypothetical protein
MKSYRLARAAMNKSQFALIKHFKPGEVTRTGAKLKDVDFRTIFVVDKFRQYLGCPVKLIKNGLTTGDHRDLAHPRGKAVDCYPTVKKSPQAAFKAALKAGAKVIGIYWNGRIYSYHLGLGPRLKFWTATKGANNAWKYHGLVVDPAEIGRK